MPITKSTAALTLSTTLAVALTSGSALAQAHACERLELLSTDDHREVHFVDFDGDGPSIGDRRLGHRRLVDADGNVRADRMWTVTVHEVDDAGEPTMTASESVTAFPDGNVFSRIENRDPANVDDHTTPHSSAQRPPQEIIGGTGAYAGATGTVEVIRGDDNHMTFIFDLDCR
ncbi:MAG: hypothetical protein AAFX92_02150 [Pseudomonadota bacterium]